VANRAERAVWNGAHLSGAQSVHRECTSARGGTRSTPQL
jgi:hypothetical protein